MKRITEYAYQQIAAEFLARCFRALLIAPAGSGKTIVAALALHMVWSRKQRGRKLRIGWLAATIEQCAQARAAFTSFPDLLADIVLEIFCAAGAPDVFEFDLLIVDECHHCSARTWAAIVNAHTGAIWLMSATPWTGDPERDAFLRGLVGANIHTVDRSEVSSRLVQADVYLLPDTDPDLREPIDAEIARRVRAMVRGKIDYGEAYKRCASQVAVEFGIIPNRARNAAIVRTAVRHANDSTLVLVGQIEHGEALSANIPGSMLCYSKMGARKRREAMEAFRAGELLCMLATSLADEGLDLPCANVLLMAGAGRSASRTEQRTGRVLRAHEGKERGTIYDFLDRQHPLLERQACARQFVYTRLGYRIHRTPPVGPVGPTPTA